MAQDCTNLDNFFAAAVNQFVEPIYNWIWLTNPFISIVPRSMYDYKDGLTPRVLTSTAGLPTSYPTNLPSVGYSTGSGTSGCDYTPTVIPSGYTERNYHLVEDHFVTDPLCLTDLQFDWQAAQMATNLQELLRQYITVRWADWYRIENICMIDNKVSTTSGSGLTQISNQNCNFSGLTLPTRELEWYDLNVLYDTLIRTGATQVGYSEGQLLYPLILGPGYKRKLWQDNTQVRDTVNWGDAFQNFVARGINTSINGFIPDLDDFPIRYQSDGTTAIYPFRNVATTSGIKFEFNPNYRTVARGGLAVYEVVTILPTNTWEVKVRPSAPTTFGMANFDPINWFGDITWINNKTFCGANDRGTKGYYAMDLSMAAKPVRPDVAFEILTLAKD